jgi:sigma-B regulation protein RsbU (phosphoserine phosphatase)
LKKPDGKYEMIKDKHGFVIGGMEDMAYKNYELQLEPGTKLFLYTDGLPEAEDADHNMFGIDRILTALNEQPDAAPEQVLSNMTDAVNAFVKETEQFDDLTMLCLEYKGPAAV